MNKDSDYFYALQTQTGWGRTLSSFAEWCGAEPGRLCLDVGCGPGLLPAILTRQGSRALGVDVDPQMFNPTRVYPDVAVAEGERLPFERGIFDLVTATNLLFLLDQPVRGLVEMKRVLKPGGKVALLNPSEHINVEAVRKFAAERNLEDIARDTLLNYARRAEENHHWTEDETRVLYRQAGMTYMAGVLKMGPGFARFSWGTA